MAAHRSRSRLTWLLALSIAGCLMGADCSEAEDDDAPDAGSAGTAGTSGDHGGSAGTAGTSGGHAGSAGTAGTGGIGGTSGNHAGSAGTAGTGGSAGTAGISGGASGTGGTSGTGAPVTSACQMGSCASYSACSSTPPTLGEPCTALTMFCHYCTSATNADRYYCDSGMWTFSGNVACEP
jgi:hypothetical protein